MALVRWNPWTELTTLKRDIRPPLCLHVPELFGNGGAYNAFWMPRLDVRETDSAFIVEADLPGMTIEDIAVEVEGQTLIIGGERKAERVSDTGNVAHRERMFGKFQRTFTLPAEVKVDGIEARYTNGVLAVTVPKAEEAHRYQKRCIM